MKVSIRHTGIVTRNLREFKFLAKIFFKVFKDMNEEDNIG